MHVRLGSLAHISCPRNTSSRRNGSRTYRRMLKKACASVARPRDDEGGEHQALCTPLLSALAEKGRARDDIPFHIPGHKKGSGVLPAFRELMESPLGHDLTEVPGLDFLSSPQGVIKHAQQLAAAAFGADQTWFLVNGTTVGIHAAVMATCGPEDTIIVARNCHLSAFSAMALSGCHPTYLTPGRLQDDELGIAHGISPEALAAAFSKAKGEGRRIGAVLLVCPTYFGVCSNITALAEMCHSHGVPLMVDEAHGGHFAFHPSFPEAALALGADVSIQSTHKVLSSMGQSSMLHVRGNLVHKQRVARALQALQSSSPSFLLLASLDAARAHAQLPGTFQEPIQAAAAAKQLLSRLPGMALLDEHIHIGTEGAHALDPLRLTVVTDDLGITGMELDKILYQSHGIFPELSTMKTVVFALGPGSTMAHVDRLAAAMKAVASEHAPVRYNGSSRSRLYAAEVQEAARESASCQLPMMAMTPREAFFAATEKCLAKDVHGRVSAELLCPYPPGVPAIVPGEVYTNEIVQQLQSVVQMGGKVTGAADETLRTLNVIR